MKSIFCLNFLRNKISWVILVSLCLALTAPRTISANTLNQKIIDSYSISVDGVQAILSSGFSIKSFFYTPQPYDVVQNTFSAEFKPLYKEISLLAIPYGITPVTESLPVASPNSESVYRDALRNYRETQAGNPQAGIVGNMFGREITGIYSIVSLSFNEEKQVPVLIVEWVEEISSRIWILRISHELPNSYDDLITLIRYLRVLENFQLSSSNLDTPSTSKLSSNLNTEQIENESQPPQISTLYSDLPTPPWWSGDCDTNYFFSVTGVNSYRLGAVYRNMPACGPKGYTVVRSFGTGVSQLEFQCPELSKRFLYQAYGIAPYSANGSQVVWNYTGSLLQKIYNGTAGKAPQPNDVLSYGATTTAGHTSVVASSSVDGSGNGSITVIEENSSNTGWQTSVSK